VNGALRPRIEIAPGERQFWRIVNASPDRYLDLQLDGQTLEIVALDGMPLAYHEPKAPTRTTNHLLLAPAGRLEAIVTGPPRGTHSALRTLCVDAGPDGDPHPEMNPVQKHRRLKRTLSITARRVTSQSTLGR